MKYPLVSVIVTTRNEEKNIERLLKSIQKQTYKNTEMIVVDNNSQDNTIRLAKKYTQLVFQAGPERSAQRNYGAKKAQGAYFAFLDADMELGEDVLKECVEIAAQNKKLGGVIIPEISIGNTYWEKVKAFERSFYFGEKDSEIEAARFFPKEIFQKFKGYDEEITGPEDWDLPERIKKKGFTIYRCISSLYHYESIPNLFSLAKKKYYYGLRAHRYLQKQNVSMLSNKTLYFLRSSFYKQPKKYVDHPLLALGMIVMLTLELFAGGMGYMSGKTKKP